MNLLICAVAFCSPLLVREKGKTMPGPGSKQKSKQKPKKLPAPKQSVSTSKEVALRDPSSDLAQEVAGATGWVAIEDVLIKLLGLPGAQRILLSVSSTNFYVSGPSLYFRD